VARLGLDRRDDDHRAVYLLTGEFMDNQGIALNSDAVYRATTIACHHLLPYAQGRLKSALPAQDSKAGLLDQCYKIHRGFL